MEVIAKGGEHLGKEDRVKKEVRRGVNGGGGGGREEEVGKKSKTGDKGVAEELEGNVGT